MASNRHLKSKRSFTGNHALLPAIRPAVKVAEMTQQPAYSLLAWTFGRGSVIWRIWPAVLLHTLFAAAIVSAFEEGPDWVHNIAIPNVMLTVLGVVIGFVISYRAMSGYDRYWMGRTTWSDVIRNTRTMGRLIWYHVPPQLTPKTPKERETGQLSRSTGELMKVMAEKRMALDLVEGFAVALKHHIRGETGIYFEDLYDLVRPLHEHEHTEAQKAAAVSSALPPPSKARRVASNPRMPEPTGTPPTSSGIKKFFGDSSVTSPPANAYGTFQGSQEPSRQASRSSLRHALRRSPSGVSDTSINTTHQPLQASQQPGDNNMMDQVSSELIPFAGMFGSIRRWFRGTQGYSAINGDDGHKDPMGAGASQRKWGAPLQPRIGSRKHTVHREENGENLPLEILRCLSEW